MVEINVDRGEIRRMLLAESTNAARTLVRSDGVSEFENVVIDEQADSSLTGAWRQANAKLTEKMKRFVVDSELSDENAGYVLSVSGVMLEDNIKGYIVNYMMQDWMAGVRPDMRQSYVETANFELDDLLRKLYTKHAPYEDYDPDEGGGRTDHIEPISEEDIDIITS